MLPLSQLHFDAENPRFGDQGMVGQDERSILEEIVKVHGIEDVLSSIAANGYFPSEPLVGKRIAADRVDIIEGNRRLAALLILSGDPRSHIATLDRLRKNHPLSPHLAIDPVPVMVYPPGAEPAALLPYLGVRHIVGAKEWDSYAKAAWVARVLEQGKGKLKLAEIERMIGDQKGTLRRILEGYYLVNQVHAARKYLPEDSRRLGRGSNSRYPFSWVYNVLAYKGARAFVGLGERNPKRELVAEDRLDAAGQLMTYMFGNETHNTRAAIDDSRELGDLAECLADEQKVALLNQGLTVADVVRKGRPGSTKMRDALTAADLALREAWEAAPEIGSAEEAAKFLTPATNVRKRATDVHKRIIGMMSGDDDV